MKRAPAPHWAGRSAPAVLRRLLGRWLARAQAAVARLGADRDGEALHDFRVALRRLRTAARAYGELAAELVPDKPRRKLKRLAADTNATRDAEVFAAWLQAQRKTLPA
ncbi:MAG: CHAD domain-containing protein, partial [Nevskia sp.]|nr:CHAD domain-containing protein [Nevskia sp.]